MGNTNNTTSKKVTINGVEYVVESMHMVTDSKGIRHMVTGEKIDSTTFKCGEIGIEYRLVQRLQKGEKIPMNTSVSLFDVPESYDGDLDYLAVHDNPSYDGDTYEGDAYLDEYGYMHHPELEFKGILLNIGHQGPTKYSFPVGQVSALVVLGLLKLEDIPSHLHDRLSLDLDDRYLAFQEVGDFFNDLDAIIDHMRSRVSETKDVLEEIISKIK